MYFLTRYCQVKRQMALLLRFYTWEHLSAVLCHRFGFAGMGAALLPLTTIPLIRMVINHEKAD